MKQQVASQPGDQANGSWKEISVGKPGHPGSASCSNVLAWPDTRSALVTKKRVDDCGPTVNSSSWPLWLRQGVAESSSYRVGGGAEARRTFRHLQLPLGPQTGPEDRIISWRCSVPFSKARRARAAADYV